VIEEKRLKSNKASGTLRNSEVDMGEKKEYID